MPTFLQKILPDEGYYCIVGLKDGVSPKQSFHSIAEDVETRVKEDSRENQIDLKEAIEGIEADMT